MNGNSNSTTETTPLLPVDPRARTRDQQTTTKQVEDDSSTFLLQKEEHEQQQQQLGILQRLLFRWFVPLLDRGNSKQRLDQDDLDLVPLPQDCTTESVSNVFEKYWNEELNNSNNNTHNKEPSLVRALFRSFGADFMKAGLLKLVHDLCIFVGPQVLHGMIQYLRNPNSPLYEGITLTVVVTVSQLLMSLCLRHYFFRCYRTGLRIRTAVVMAVYKKALVLSAKERRVRSLGEITNLTSIDAERLQQLTSYLHALWYSPFQIVLALIFLWQQLGASSLGGVAVIVIVVPVARYVAKIMGNQQKLLMIAKDQRVELNGEVLAGMKVVKMQAWENPFEQRILDLRNVELRRLLNYFLVSILSRVLWSFTPLAVALATFAAYVWSGHELDVASALTALALFSILRFPLFMLPQIINNTVEAAISLQRIRSFLLCEEHKHVPANDLDGIGVRLDNVSASYESKKPKAVAGGKATINNELINKEWEISLLKAQLQDAENRILDLTGRDRQHRHYESTGAEVEGPTSSDLFCLKRIDFDCKAGQVVAVFGAVGSGKSTLINAILGEVRELTSIGGTGTSVKGDLAYFSQVPFIMNASLKDNILFGHVDEHIDEALYDRALDCCALRHDLELLPNGDATEIGEKGVTLSGGQKARLSLARAVYHQADITLIDDALSAVDAHVAEHLFEKAIVGELMRPKTSNGGVTSQRCVILATNALQYLKHPSVTKIAVLSQCSIVEQGTYSELACNMDDSVFSRFLRISNHKFGGGSGGGEISTSEKLIGSVDVDDDDETALKHSRSSDSSSSKKEDASSSKANTMLMTEETRRTGHVGLSVYWSWIDAAGGLIAPIAILLAFSLGEGMNVLTNWFLTYWSEHGGSNEGGSQNRFLAIYALINVGAVVALATRMLLLLWFGLRASRKLFTDMLSVVLHANQSFFDTTPIGRLINRFSKDTYAIDEQLMNTLRMYLQTIFAILSTIVVISGITPVFTVFLIPMLLYYAWQLSQFTITYRELKRLDSSNRSPIYALLGETVDGVAVIRSFSAEACLVKRLTSMLDLQQHAFFLMCTAQSWLALRLELIGTLIITCTALSAIFEHQFVTEENNETFAGLAGLAFSYALSVTQSLNWSVRMAADMENNMVAVERVQEYTMLPSEGERVTDINSKLVGWPLRGEIKFIGVKLRYRPGLPLVLKGLNLSIPAGSKVGVVGRTGAGKTTLVTAMLRIVELCDGRILIDDQDIRQVGLTKLRSNIATIPQDPTLYSGTVRSNLDPFNEYDDDRLYETLERVGLYNKNALSYSGHGSAASGSTGDGGVSASRIESLDDSISEGGLNLSVGQRQLVIIGRSLLHGAKIVIVDEATASIDAETDAAVQRVMHDEFKSATVITVAHRINTIMGSDYILVMADGIASEFDRPQKLLEDENGLFSNLVRAAVSASAPASDDS